VPLVVLTLSHSYELGIYGTLNCDFCCASRNRARPSSPFYLQFIVRRTETLLLSSWHHQISSHLWTTDVTARTCHPFTIIDLRYRDPVEAFGVSAAFPDTYAESTLSISDLICFSVLLFLYVINFSRCLLPGHLITPAFRKGRG